MRVAIVGPSEVDDFAYNIADGLRRLGHGATTVGSVRARQRFGFAGKAWSVARDGLIREPRISNLLANGLVRRIAASEPDVVITVESLHPEVVERIDGLGIPVVLWFPDAVSNLGPLWMFAAAYRALFFKEPVLVDRVASLTNLPVFYLPEACNPSLHHIPKEVLKTGKVAVVGNYYATRVRLLERLHADGIPLELYGSPFPPFMGGHPLAALHTGHYLRGSAKASVFRNASAILNNLHPAEIEGVNCRLFEATACGAAVVCEDRGALGELFERGSEVATFSTYDELVDLLRTFVASEQDSIALGDAACSRSHREHTYEVRLRSLFEMAL